MKTRFADYLLPVAIIITPLAAAIISIYGRPTVVLDAFYNRVWQDDARSGLIAAAISAGILAILLVLSTIRIRFEEIKDNYLLSTNIFLTLLFLVGISVLSNYQAWGVFGIFKLLLFFWISFVFLRSGLTQKSFHISSIVVLVSYLLIAIFPIFSPLNSWKICRDDKCTISGSLLTSFFQSENALSLYVLTTIFFIRFLERNWQRWSGYLLAFILTYFSGSRLGLAVVVIVVLLLVFNKRFVLVISPLVAMIVSATLFFLGRGSDITGRGFIFSAVKEIWLANPIFGVGPNASQTAFEKGMVIGFIPYNEQTEVAHLLAHYGLLVTMVFVGMILILLRSSSTILGDQALFSLVAPFLIASLAFVTESPASFTIDCPSFWVLSLLFAKVDFADSAGFEGVDSFQSANPYKRSPASPSPGTM